MEGNRILAKVLVTNVTGLTRQGNLSVFGLTNSFPEVSPTPFHTIKQFDRKGESTSIRFQLAVARYMNNSCKARVLD
jgi:hypothetical protein